LGNLQVGELWQITVWSQLFGTHLRKIPKPLTPTKIKGERNMKKNRFIKKLMEACDTMELISFGTYLSIACGIAIAAIIKLATGG
jgi:hypothetical protein